MLANCDHDSNMPWHHDTHTQIHYTLTIATVSKYTTCSGFIPCTLVCSFLQWRPKIPFVCQIEGFATSFSFPGLLFLRSMPFRFCVHLSQVMMTLLAVGNSLYGGACGTLVIIAPTWECGSYLPTTKIEATSENFVWLLITYRLWHPYKPSLWYC